MLININRNSFLHGLWGVGELPIIVEIPLSVVAGVGIINAVNLIDGVDGYSSGDGGTLMLGALMTVLLFYTMSSKQSCEILADKGIGLGAFSIAVLCIPVFDTLRVMSLRIIRGKSPFSPDKTHLHHLFIDMGFSHLGAALFILMINTMVVLIWWASWKLGASIDMQLYIVIGMGFAVTFGFYKLMKIQQNGGPCDEEGYPQGTRLWHVMMSLGNFSHGERLHLAPTHPPSRQPPLEG